MVGAWWHLSRSVRLAIVFVVALAAMTRVALGASPPIADANPEWPYHIAPCCTALPTHAYAVPDPAHLPNPVRGGGEVVQVISVTAAQSSDFVVELQIRMRVTNDRATTNEPITPPPDLRVWCAFPTKVGGGIYDPGIRRQIKRLRLRPGLSGVVSVQVDVRLPVADCARPIITATILHPDPRAPRTAGAYLHTNPAEVDESNYLELPIDVARLVAHSRPAPRAMPSLSRVCVAVERALGPALSGLVRLPNRECAWSDTRDGDDYVAVDENGLHRFPFLNLGFTAAPDLGPHASVLAYQRSGAALDTGPTWWIAILANSSELAHAVGKSSNLELAVWLARKSHFTEPG